jgi:hypothetical protein
MDSLREGDSRMRELSSVSSAVARRARVLEKGQGARVQSGWAYLLRECAAHGFVSTPNPLCGHWSRASPGSCAGATWAAIPHPGCEVLSHDHNEALCVAPVGMGDAVPVLLTVGPCREAFCRCSPRCPRASVRPRPPQPPRETGRQWGRVYSTAA